MSHANLVRERTRDIIEAFLRGRPECNPVTGRVTCESGQVFDAAFGNHLRALGERHRAKCPKCADGVLCVTGDALVELTPDPYTGVVSAFHDFLLRNGRFDAVTTRGEVFVTPEGGEVRMDYRPDEPVPALVGEEARRLHFWNCRCCGQSHPGLYMVLDETWSEAGVHRRGGNVCVGCLDVRLKHRRGRGLDVADLGTFAVNAAIFWFLDSGYRDS